MIICCCFFGSKNGERINYRNIKRTMWGTLESVLCAGGRHTREVCVSLGENKKIEYSKVIE